MSSFKMFVNECVFLNVLLEIREKPPFAYDGHSPGYRLS